MTTHRKSRTGSRLKSAPVDVTRLFNSKHSLRSLLMFLACYVRDLCHFHFSKHRLIENLNMDNIVMGALSDFDLAADFDQQLAACIEAMSQDNSTGQILAFARDGDHLQMLPIQPRDLAGIGRKRYEMLLFDGGNTQGERWKHVFFLTQRMHSFVLEAP
jgi:hypothetical protein